MLNVSRPSCVRSVLFCLLATLAGPTAQAQTPSTPLSRQLDRIDLAVSGVGVFNQLLHRHRHDQHANSVPLDHHPRQHPRRARHPALHRQAMDRLRRKFGYARYTQKFSTIGGVQQNAREYTLGYVAHTPRSLGIRPFVSVGLGTTAFRPTPGGGRSLLEQARATYYYSLGAEKDVTAHFGLRAQFRQSFFLAPDFGQNYLTIQQHTTTFQPGIGFFLRF